MVPTNGSVPAAPSPRECLAQGEEDGEGRNQVAIHK